MVCLESATLQAPSLLTLHTTQDYWNEGDATVTAGKNKVFAANAYAVKSLFLAGVNCNETSSDEMAAFLSRFIFETWAFRLYLGLYSKVNGINKCTTYPEDSSPAYIE